MAWNRGLRWPHRKATVPFGTISYDSIRGRIRSKNGHAFSRGIGYELAVTPDAVLEV